MKACKDCKYHTEDLVSYFVYRDGCHFPPPHDVVTGASLKPVDCYEFRAETSSIENKCGPKGKHWTPEWARE